MPRSTKAFIGFLSFLPIVLLIAFFILLFSLFPTFFEWENYGPAPQEVFGAFGPLFIVIFLLGILSIGLFIFFLIHLLRHKHMDSIEKVVWILVFIFVGLVGYPIYWYMRIWNDQPGPL